VKTKGSTPDTSKDAPIAHAMATGLASFAIWTINSEKPKAMTVMGCQAKRSVFLVKSVPPNNLGSLSLWRNKRCNM